MSDEVKIVVNFKENAAMIGIGKPDCDPILSKAEGNLSVVLKAVPKLVADAQASWEANPKYKKCETDLKPPPAPAREITRSQPKAKAKAKAKDEQPELI